MFWTYILKCSDGSYYTGHTDNLEQRLVAHQQGLFPSCFTFRRRPLTLEWQQGFPTRIEALAAEQQIKGWSRKKKEALITECWDLLRELSQSHTQD